ncbi:hypothetical protein PC129_g20419 [Phytophthora cactorum]|uniref:Uncharacterized protein n=1 Tax=Phytophthora cactorum TaxID=29920 RepID=A0A329RCS5_9STRA|nr:hypothetical protein Pcac1_g19817 [Phytophthora cactorum]KAG2798735.1 hypothetical protein PC112_g21225 [Phytophthora cactorum]KAG2798838.1 hypothetical protein PC111_g20680 [Phytophthora cactorum]KAG2827891.1 hypothetical protein PC113_g21543 [Phytophthora cactorum]KAG2877909.1 hypothetical protein PC114_g23401 [Phytophthora cactorum]
MTSELLKLRFEEGEVHRKIDKADTNIKRALAWQLFASSLSQRLNQVSAKFKKMKFEYRKRKGELSTTGNNPRSAMDDTYWSILNNTFSDVLGISGDMMFDSNLEVSDIEADSRLAVPKLDKKPPLVQLVATKQTGMEAIAATMTPQKDNPNRLRELQDKLP